MNLTEIFIDEDIPEEIQKLKKYDSDYYNTDIYFSDDDYDLLKENARLKYPNHSYFNGVGSKPQKNKKFDLPYILGSLNKIKDVKKFQNWYESNIDYTISEKLDGLSIYVKYIDDKIIQASTRGDGTIGQDIIDKAMIFCPIPFNNSGILELRGEVLLPGDKYKELDKKNRRNACSGIINQKGTENCEFLIVKFYEIINTDNQKNSEYERFKKLNLLFDDLNISKYKLFNQSHLTFNILKDQLFQWKKECFDNYDIDGIVVTKNKSTRENIYYPKNKIAFKIDEKFKTTNVNDCFWKTSRTGRIKPVLYIDPVELDGVIIKKVTAHNYDYIEKNKIGKNTEIDIQRSGDVIPYILKVHKSNNINHFLISTCPSCGQNVCQDGVDLICKNINCPAQIIGRIHHFITSLEIDGIKELTIEKIFNNTNVKSIEDFYNLTIDQLYNLDGFGDKKINNIISETQKSLNCKPENLLAGFGIDGIGKENAKKLLEKYSFDELFDINLIDNIEGFGEITSKKFIEGMKKNKFLYKFLQNKGLTFIENKKKNISNEMIFTLTGTGNKSRNEYQKEIENMGATVKGISSNSTYLVTNDINSSSGKMKKAQKMEIKIISYNDLENLILKNT